MENKSVGLLIIGIAVVMVIIVIIFNFALNSIVGVSCSMGSSCTMYDTIKVQTWISLAIVAVIFIIGLIIMFSKPKEKIVIKTIKEKKKKLNLDGLDNKEKEVVKILEEENGTIFQATLMEKIGIGKVGITRLLDKLEAKQIIERKRRGMNNVVVLR
ncbi:MAG: hypothetical protein WC584_00865 [Candidatus Pacearchaeota archaeon]